MENNITKDNLDMVIRESMLILMATFSATDEMYRLDTINIKKIIAGTMIYYKRKNGFYFKESDMASLFLKYYPVNKFDNDDMISSLIAFIKCNIINAKEVLDRLELGINEKNITRVICLAFVIDMLIEKKWYININLNSETGVEIKKLVKSLM